MNTRPMRFFDTPLLRWTGAKWMLADWVTSTFPPHNIYVEPYCGSAAIFLRKQPSAIEVLNDLNSDLVNFFRVLRARPDELIEQIELTPFSREEYELSYQAADDELERARRFYVCCRQSFGAFSGQRTGWRKQTSFNRGTSLTREWSRINGLWSAAMALKEATIEHDDALEVIKRYDTPETLFYVDPPYVLKSRSQGVGRKRYLHELSDNDHCQLAEVLHGVSGMVVLSGYDSELYRSLYAGWSVLSKSTTTNGNGSAIEYLWLSPRTTSIQHLPLFSSSAVTEVE